MVTKMLPLHLVEMTRSLTFSLRWVLNLFSVTAGAKKLANKAALWYVPCSLRNVDKIMEVPPIKVHGNSNCLHLKIVASYPLASLCLNDFSTPPLTAPCLKWHEQSQDRNGWHLIKWKVPFTHLCFEYMLVSSLCFTPRVFVQRVVFEWIYARVFNMLNIFFLQYASAEQEEEGRKRYEAQKMERLETKARIEEVMPSPPNPGNIFKLRVLYQFADTKPHL